MRGAVFAIVALPLASLAWGDTGADKPPTGVVVRIAALAIDPAQLESYEAAVKEEMEAAVRLEPGVLAIYAVAEKDHPTRLRFFEMYASEEAYRSHVDSPHFKKYVAVTKPIKMSPKALVPPKPES